MIGSIYSQRPHDLAGIPLSRSRGVTAAEDDFTLVPSDEPGVLTKYVNTAAYNAREFLLKQRSTGRLFESGAEIFNDAHNYISEKDFGTRPLFFFLAAESAYLASAYLGAALVTLEVWKTLRGCLEAAAYGVCVDREPDSWKAWLEQNKDQKTSRQVGYLFSFRRIQRDHLDLMNPKLSSVAGSLYAEAIERGAHFNERGFRANLARLNTQTRRGMFNLIGGDTESILYSWRKVLEVAHCSLRIMELVYGDRLREGAISARIYQFGRQIKKLPAGRG
jgi:hypothetical protein